jgi:hypothetical protein
MDTSSATTSSPLYGGGPEEFAYRSRALRWCMTGMGFLFFAMSLWMMVMAFSLLRHETPAESTTVDVASLPPELQEIHHRTEIQAEQNRRTHYLIAGSIAANALGILIIVPGIALLPWMILRRGRRRAAEWQTRRQAGPYVKGGSLVPFAAAIVTWTLQPGFLLAAWLVMPPPAVPPLLVLALCAVGQLLGLAAFAWVLATMRRRRNFRPWRIQVAEFPVLPGQSVSFQITRSDGRPLDPGVRLALAEDGVSRAGPWLIGHFLRRGVGGEVTVAKGEADAKIVAGTLCVDDVRLTLTPPPDGRQRGRVFIFLRVRLGWWMKCRFEVPLPAVYLAAKNHTA